MVAHRVRHETLFCMVNDDRINRAYSPPLEVVNSVFSEYSTAASQVTMILDGITNFKRNFHILEKTGLFTRDSRFGLMVCGSFPPACPWMQGQQTR